MFKIFLVFLFQWSICVFLGYDFNLYFLIIALLLLFKWYHVQQKHAFFLQSQMCWVNVIHSIFCYFLQLFLWIFVIFFNIDKFSYVFSLTDHSNICSIFSIFFLQFVLSLATTLLLFGLYLLWVYDVYTVTFLVLFFCHFLTLQNSELQPRCINSSWFG